MSVQLIGRTIDTYRIDALLGEGGMGAVYRAHDLNLNRAVAVKVTRQALADRPEFQRRFLQEARAAAQLDHPSVIKVHDFGSAQRVLFMVVEYIDGGNLSAYLRDIRPGQTFDLQESLHLLAQVADGLAYAHRRDVIHRDVKPDNIMLKRLDGPEQAGGPPLRAVVTDFGLAKLLHGEALTQTGTFMGTMAYMSPEQCQGRTLDGRSDIYSLGIVLFQLATGRLPFNVKTPTEAVSKHVFEAPPRPESVRADLPEAVIAVIDRALEKEPAQRYGDAAEMARALREAARETATAVSTGTIVMEGSVSLMTRLTSMSRISEPSRLGSDIHVAGVDQLIVSQKGKTPRAYELAEGTVTLGRGPDNTIQLGASSVSFHHARLERSAQGWTITDLNSTNGTFLGTSRLLPDVAEPWSPGQMVRIGPYFLQWKAAGGQRTGATAMYNPSEELLRTPPGGTRMLTTGGQVALTMHPAEVEVAPGQTVQMQVELLNHSMTVEHYALAVEKIPEEWVRIERSAVQLMPGNRVTVPVTIQPARDSTSRAGQYDFRLIVRSQSDSSENASVPATLHVQSFELFALDVHPSELRHGHSSRVTVRNKGNRPKVYTVTGTDPAGALDFRGLEEPLAVEAGGESEMTVTMEARRRKWLGSPQTRPFTLSAASASGATQSKGGRVNVPPIIPLWLLPVMLLLLFTCAAAGGFLWMDRQNEAQAQAAVTMTAEADATATAERATELALAADSDGDGLTDVEEEAACTDPDSADTDGDGLGDKEELDGWVSGGESYASDPCEEDSDGDGLLDGEEREHGTDPWRKDSDGDTLDDGKEVHDVGSSPTNPDTDNDGAPDNVDADPGRPPTLTPTPTHTPTVTPSSTPTLTPTPSPSLTNTPTPTPSPRATLNASGNPTYGSLTLSNGFEPAQYGERVRSGGPVDAAEALGLDRCVGYAAVNPDFRLNWSGGGYLGFSFNPDSSDEETTLIVNGPNDVWLCSDPKLYAIPVVGFHDAPTGEYNVWIANYSPSEGGYGSLRINQIYIRP